MGKETMAGDHKLSVSDGEIIVAPSMLAADFACLKDQLKAVERGGAKFLHIDVMDGHFVPNLSFGPGIVKSLRPHSSMLFDVHLMITDPIKYVESFVAVGADHVTVHVEVEEDLRKTLSLIRRLGVSAGISLKPGTPAVAIAPYLNDVDLVLVMTVEPGFGGQSFMTDQMSKTREIKRMIDESGKCIRLQADGGIGPDNAMQCVEAGIDVLVAGSSVFGATGGAERGVVNLLNACAKGSEN